MKHLATLFFLIICAVISAQAQQGSANVSGIITDPNNAALGGARIILSNKISQSDRAATTDETGAFRFENVAAGEYIVRIAANGFGEKIVPVEIAAGETQKLEIDLSIEQPSATVTAETGQVVNLETVPQAVNLINAENILERSRSVLAQIGEEESGLNVQRTSPTIGAVVVRGLTGKNVVTYVDGVRYTNSAQRGGVNTFFNLNEPTLLQSVEVLRGANSAQYGSDALAGTINLVTKNPIVGGDSPEFHGEVNTQFNSADSSFGGSTLFSYGTSKLGGYVNLSSRRINPLRTADGIDSHSSVTRFLGLPSTVLYDRNPDTGFTQYGGAARLNYSPDADSQLIFSYQRSQQDGGKRFDQLVGGDGNLISDLRNLMLDFGYLRYVRQNFIGFDSASFTASYNSQREERVNQGGQGNPVGVITHQYERTSVTGFSFFLDKALPKRNVFTFGGDFYHEKLNSPAFTFDPVTNLSTLSRPRIPDEARFDMGGLFIQNAWEAIPNRLRVAGALRYSAAHYKVRATDSPLVNGRPLWQNDSIRNSAFSGRVGAVARVFDNLRVAFNYSRGFRYPSMTDLGTLGLTGDGFEIDYLTAQALNGTFGTTAGANAVSTGLPIEKQEPEYTNNYDLSLRFNNKWIDTEATGFLLDLENTITKQTLILPQGAVGKFIGDQRIITQNANGAVFVAASTAPVLARVNFTTARIYGFEYELEARVTRDLRFRGNYTFIHSKDKDSGLPPNIEGGTPPPTVFLSLRYQQPGKPYTIEFFSTLADKQNRLSSLDLSDRRTGAARSRTQIQNYFRRGACVRGLTTPGTNGQCGSAGGILIATGETQAQVQNRLLPLGAIINGVLVANNDSAVPLFTSLPGYGLANVRGSYNIGERSQIFLEFRNIFDQQYRNASWGIDGEGRSFRASYRLKF